LAYPLSLSIIFAENTIRRKVQRTIHLFIPLLTHLDLQGLLHVPSLIIIIVAPINALLNYVLGELSRLTCQARSSLMKCHVLVWGPAPFTSLRMGYIGAPIATAISFNLISILSLTYALLWAPREAWHPLNDGHGWRRVFATDSLGYLTKLGLAGVGQTAVSALSGDTLTMLMIIA